RLLDQAREWSPDISSDYYLCTRSLHQFSDQGRRCCFSIRAGDSDDPAAEESAGQLRLAYDLDSARARRIKSRKIRGDAGAEHNKIGGGEQAWVMSADADLGPERSKLLNLRKF